jgi:cytochrome P450
MALSFDPTDPSFRRDPHGLLAQGRADCPTVVHPGPPRSISVLRYDDVRTILRDWQTYSSEIGSDDTASEFGALLGDPPDHDRIRALLERAFRPRMVQRFGPRLRQVADELLDSALRSGEVEMVEAFAGPLPVIAIAELLGVPAEDRELFKAWSDEAFSTLGLGLFGGITDELRGRHGALMKEMSDYFAPHVEARRQEPREDLLSGMVSAEDEGSKLNYEEMISSMLLLLVAGNETTTSLIGNALLAFDAFPEEQARLRQDPSLLDSAVEEVLRFCTPVQFDPRRAARDVELHGTSIRKGDLVLPWLSSANRDEKVFERPEHFDIGRGRTPHLTFGLGIHHCLGANLARLETRVALGALFEKTRSFSRADDRELPLHPSPVFKAVTELPLRLEPAR